MSNYLIPSVTYNAGAGNVTINFTVPSKAHRYVSVGFGGSDRSAAGIPESFEIRREQHLIWTLTFLESEWTAVETWLRAMQKLSISCTWKPDKSQGTTHTVYLDKPSLTDEIAPVRRSDYIGAFDIELTFRRTTSTVFDIPIV